MLTRPCWCGARQVTSPLPGPDRSRIPIWTWCPTRNRSTACTVPSCSNRPNTSRTTAWTCSSGSRATSPDGRRTYPAGSGTASSPRPALASRPEAIRCLIRCSSTSAHRALQPQQKAVVVPVRIVNPVRIGQQRPGQRAQLDQLVPVLARAGQPRHLQPQHQAHMPHRDLRDQPREPRPLRRARRRPPQVLIDHHHPGGRPAQRGRPLGSARTAAASTHRDRRPAGAKTAGHTRPPAGHGASPGSCRHRAHPPAPCSPPFPSAASPAETAHRSRSMPSSPRMSFRFPSGNDLHSSPSGTLCHHLEKMPAPPATPRLPRGRALAASRPIRPAGAGPPCR